MQQCFLCIKPGTLWFVMGQHSAGSGQESGSWTDAMIPLPWLQSKPASCRPEGAGSAFAAGTGWGGSLEGGTGLWDPTRDGAGAEEGPNLAWGLPAMSLALPANTQTGQGLGTDWK